MSIIKVNGVELEFDLLDADMMEHYESALEKVKISGEKSQEENLTASEAIRSQCRTIFDFFNEVFGDGMDRTLFGDRTNLGICMDAFEVVMYEAEKQQIEFTKRAGKYNPARAKRP